MRTRSGLEFGTFRIGPTQSGQRREEKPPLRWIKFGLDSYVDPEPPRLHQSRYT